jgi:hypothetical protein
MLPSARPEGSVEIFCSYSHKDEPLRREFESHVAMLRRQNLVQIWHDRQILSGDDWAGDLDEHLNTADIVTLFVSSDFLASDYCYEKEMTRAMARAAQKEALVVPIIVRPCDWSDAPFGRLQAIPTDARPVTKWENRDEAWTDVAKYLKITVKEVLRRVHERIKAEVQKAAPRLNLDDLLRNNKWQELSTEMQAQNQVEQMKRWQILRDTQQKIFEIQQQVTLNKSRGQDKTYKKWDEYLQQA